MSDVWIWIIYQHLWYSLLLLNGFQWTRIFLCNRIICPTKKCIKINPFLPLPKYLLTKLLASSFSKNLYVVALLKNNNEMYATYQFRKIIPNFEALSVTYPKRRKHRKIKDFVICCEKKKSQFQHKITLSHYFEKK